MRRRVATIVVVSVILMFATASAAFANGTIQGTLLRGDGGAMNGGTVDVRDASSNAFVQSASTNASGFWSVSVPAGAYKVYFTGINVTYASSWWKPNTNIPGISTTPIRSEATTVTVADGTTYPLDVTLPLSVHLLGTMSSGGLPIQAQAKAYFWNEYHTGWVDVAEPSYTSTSNASGVYDIYGFPGQYKLRLGDGVAYSAVYYNGKTDLNGADAISLFTPGQTFTYSAALVRLGTLHGVVHRADDGLPAANVDQYIYTSGGSWAGWARTGTDGTWDAYLAPGAYKIVQRGGSGYAQGYYTPFALVPLFSMGSAVTVVASQTVSVAATSPVAAAIGGTVRKRSGAGLEGISITPYFFDPGLGEYVAMNGAPNQIDGTWRLSELLPGTYKFAFVDDDWGRYLTQFWDRKPDLDSATEVTLAGGDDLSRRDATLTADVTSDTVAGSDRMVTAVLASQRIYPNASTHAGAVIVTTGYNWPDALGASALAGAVKAPVLLTYKGARALNTTVTVEVQRLKDGGATEAYVLGDEKAVGKAAYDKLVQIFGSDTKVHRLQGGNRFETSLKIAEEVRAKAPTWEGQVFVARGDKFPDALAAAPIAAKRGWPIVLAEGDGHGGLSARVKSFLSTNATAGVVLLGNESALPKTLFDSASSAVGAGKVDRWKGDDRVATSLDIASHSVAFGMTYQHTGFATGWGYADALCGGPYLASLNAPLLLTGPVLPQHPSLPPGLVRISPNVETAVFLGGTSTIAQPIRDDIVDKLQ